MRNSGPVRSGWSRHTCGPAAVPPKGKQASPDSKTLPTRNSRAPGAPAMQTGAAHPAPSPCGGGSLRLGPASERAQVRTLPTSRSHPDTTSWPSGLRRAVKECIFAWFANIWGARGRRRAVFPVAIIRVRGAQLGTATISRGCLPPVGGGGGGRRRAPAPTCHMEPSSGPSARPSARPSVCTLLPGSRAAAACQRLPPASPR